ncbi:MAG: methyl-accepting chemotaxis protein [Brevinematia bacterium]
MDKLKIGFTTKIAIILGLIIFALVFLVINLTLSTVYSNFNQHLEKVIASINEGAKEDLFGRMVSTIEAYGDYILQNKVDEYKFFKEVIEKSLYQKDDAYSIVKSENGGFLLSCFYYDGQKFHSKDPAFSEDLDLTFTLTSRMKDKKTRKDVFFSSTKRGFVYFYILDKGVIGGRILPGVFNNKFLKSIFGKSSLFHGVKVTSKSENYFSDKGILVRALEYTPQSSLDKVYENLSARLKDKTGVTYEVFGSEIAFLIRNEYVSFIHEQIIIFPLTYIFPMREIELSLLSSLPIVLSIIVLVILVNNRILRRITSLSQRVADLGKKGGDLSYRIELDVKIREVKEVADNINEFLDAIEGIVRKSKKTFKDIEEETQVLLELESEVVKVKEVIMDQSEVRQMIEEINAMTGEVGTTVEEMLRSFESIKNNIGRQYTMIEEITSMIEETIMTVSNIGKRIEKANELLSSLRDEALKSSASVRKNVEEVRDVDISLKNILEVVNVIKEISDRIEVLSMNAGIEAAHAGEAGRGFAVVAGEMGSLAEDSRKKAVEVEKIVRDVIGRIKESMERVEENGEKFVRIAERVKEISMFVEEINTSMFEVEKTNKMVMSTVGNLTNHSESIRVAMEEGKTGMEEVVKAVGEVNDATSNLNDKFSNLYSVMTSTVEVLSRASERLPEIVQSLKTLGEDLGKFRVRELESVRKIALAE